MALGGFPDTWTGECVAQADAGGRTHHFPLPSQLSSVLFISAFSDLLLNFRRCSCRLQLSAGFVQKACALGKWAQSQRTTESGRKKTATGINT